MGRVSTFLLTLFQPENNARFLYNFTRATHPSLDTHILAQSRVCLLLVYIHLVLIIPTLNTCNSSKQKEPFFFFSHLVSWRFLNPPQKTNRSVVRPILGQGQPAPDPTSPRREKWVSQCRSLRPSIHPSTRLGPETSAEPQQQQQRGGGGGKRKGLLLLLLPSESERARKKKKNTGNVVVSGRTLVCFCLVSSCLPTPPPIWLRPGGWVGCLCHMMSQATV